MSPANDFLTTRGSSPGPGVLRARAAVAPCFELEISPPDLLDALTLRERAKQISALLAAPEALVVCALRDGTPGALMEAWHARLPRAERARADSFLRAEDRARYILCRSVVRAVLAEVLSMPASELPLELAARGKPFCPPARAVELDFNLSHCIGRLLCAFTRGAHVGVDVEHVRDAGRIEGAIDALAPDEVAELRALAEPERAAAFCRCWARKEAIAKALGLGLSLPFDSFSVGSSTRDFELRRSPEVGATGSWMLKDLDVGPGFAAAVARWSPTE